MIFVISAGNEVQDCERRWTGSPVQLSWGRDFNQRS